MYTSRIYRSSLYIKVIGLRSRSRAKNDIRAELNAHIGGWSAFDQGRRKVSETEEARMIWGPSIRMWARARGAAPHTAEGRAKESAWGDRPSRDGSPGWQSGKILKLQMQNPAFWCISALFPVIYTHGRKPCALWGPGETGRITSKNCGLRRTGAKKLKISMYVVCIHYIVQLYIDSGYCH